MAKKLYRSETNKVFAGIIGGLGEYFDVDPVLLRLIWIVIVVFTGFIPGILVYIIALFLIPRRPAVEPGPQERPPYTPPQM